MHNQGRVMAGAASEGDDVAPACSKRISARREAFLAAGKEVFQEKGYAEATLDDVIALSGGSRQTLYALFGDKQGLFEAIISDRCATISEPLSAEQIAGRAPEDVLQEVGVRFLAAITSTTGLSLFRLVVAEGPRIPEIGQKFWTSGPARTRALLTEYFDRQVEHGVLRMPDTRAAAEYFVDMLPGTVRLQCLLGLREPPTAGEIKRIVRGAVDQFLHGCLIDQGSNATPVKRTVPAKRQAGVTARTARRRK